MIYILLLPGDIYIDSSELSPSEGGAGNICHTSQGCDQDDLVFGDILTYLFAFIDAITNFMKYI